MDYSYINAHPNSSVNSLDIIDYTNFVLTGGGNDCLVKLHNISDRQSIDFPKEHTHSVNNICLSQSKEFFCSTSQDNIVIWDLVKRMKTNRVQAKNDEDQMRDQILDCKILNNDIIVSCGINYKLNFFDLRQMNRVRPIYSISIGNDNLNSMNFSANNILSVGSSDGNLYSLDLRNQKITTDRFENGSIVSVDSTENACLLLFENGSVNLFDIEKEHLYFEFKASKNSINYKTNSLIVNDYYKKDIRYIISGSEEGVVNLWKIDEYNTPKRMNCLKIESMESTKEASIINNVCFDTSKNRIVSSSGSGMVHIWNNVL